MRKSPRIEVRCAPCVTGRGSVGEFFSQPAKGKSIAGAVCRLGVDFLMAKNGSGLAFDLADTPSEIGAEFVKGAELIFGGRVSVEVAY